MNDDAYREALRKKQHDDIAEAVNESAANGVITGGLYGGVGKLLTGGRTPGDFLKAGALGAATYAPIAAGTTYLGSKIMGAPDEDDPTAFTTRGLVGGLVGGGLLGAGIGALLGSGRLRGLAKLPGLAAHGAEVAAKELPMDNLLVEKLKKWAGNPGGASSAKSAALLAAILGGGSGGIGAGEGMQLDYTRNMLHHQRPQDDQEDSYVR